MSDRIEKSIEIWLGEITKGGPGSGRHATKQPELRSMGETPAKFKDESRFDFVHFGEQDAKSNQFIIDRGRNRGWVQTVSNHSQNTGITREASRLSTVISSIRVEGNRLGYAARNGSDDYYRGWHRFTVDSQGTYTQEGASLTVGIRGWTRQSEELSLLDQKKELMVLGQALAEKGYVGTMEKMPAKDVYYDGKVSHTLPPYYRLNVTGKYRDAYR